MSTLPEIRAEAVARSEAIFRKHDLLKRLLERHKTTLGRRWQKKSRPQRLGILLAAWPDMPRTHQPDFAAFRSDHENIARAAAQHRSAFLWPSINQEYLGDPRTLPILLNSRGRNPPHVFAAADHNSSNLGRVTKAVVPIFVGGHVMLLNGMTTLEEYGKVFRWDEQKDALKWLAERRQFLPGEGLIILEIQQRLLTFLVDISQRILHDIPAEKLTSDEFSILPEPLLRTSEDPTSLSNLGDLAMQAPYRPPERLDLAKIE
ncbi:hypothetical protein KJ359_011208 [Pestalotiopsis sp. 9143b]|nr:hypothetical protein KJ359_011208 [Pestalotiopsis sp. 9143b]